MAKYFALLPFNQDKISWLLEKLAIHYKTLVTIDPIIYEYCADLLIKFGTEEEYVKYANEVGQIDDYNNREEYLMIRRSIRLSIPQRLSNRNKREFEDRGEAIRN